MFASLLVRALFSRAVCSSSSFKIDCDTESETMSARYKAGPVGDVAGIYVLWMGMPTDNSSAKLPQ